MDPLNIKTGKNIRYFKMLNKLFVLAKFLPYSYDKIYIKERREVY